MKQKAISLSLSLVRLGWASSYLRDDGMERAREQRDGFCSSWEFMSREEF